MTIPNTEWAQKLIELENKLYESNDLGWKFDADDKEILAKRNNETDFVYEKLFVIDDDAYAQAKYVCWLRENTPKIAMSYLTVLDVLQDIQQTLQTVHHIFGLNPHGEEEWIAVNQLGQTITKIDHVMKI